MAKDRYIGTEYYLPARGKRLDDLLYEHDMSASALAKAIGVDRKTIYAYIHDERGINLNTAVKIADYFGVSMDWLVAR